MHTLPNEILYHIIKFTDSTSLYNWSQTSHRYNFSKILKHRIKIEWTNSQSIIDCFLRALENDDVVLVNYIFVRIEALILFESNALTSNMLLIHKYTILKKRPDLRIRVFRLERNTKWLNRCRQICFYFNN